MHPLLSKETGRRELLTGNEAIVRGALEAGVRLASSYPGTPATEIGETFDRLSAEAMVHFEWSVNEKVALELAFGACLAGARALVSMKHLGLNYGADPLSTMPYIGAVGGLVIVSAADPSCLTSPNEQDHRQLARMLGIPVLDPATPDEARRMTRFAFELSEGCELPVLLRVTTRVCHTRAPVELGALPPPRATPGFRRDPSRFLPTPDNARRLRGVLQQRLGRAEALIAAAPEVNPARRGDGRRGVIAAGSPRNALRAALAKAGVEVPTLELGAVYPLAEETVSGFLGGLDEVLIVEELEPFVEDAVAALAHRRGVGARVVGKRDGAMPWFGELDPLAVEERVRSFLHLDPREAPAPAALPLAAPPRPPVLCAGCPHRNTFHAVTAVFGERPVYVNDIGCYTLGAFPPHRAGDVLLAMGSSVPMAAGIARMTGERTVAFLGDSTFFHSGLPPLVNAVQNRDDVVVVVMDNHLAAMTGLQPSPSTPAEQNKLRIPDVVRALGVQDVQVVQVEDLGALTNAFQRARGAKGVSVVVAEGPCALYAPPKPEAARPQVGSDCHTCGMDEAGLHCGLSPSVAVQRRVAAQRAMPGAPEAIPRTSPCSVECPVGICIPAYVGAIAAGEPDRALQAVTLRAALPSVCSHVCHRPCETACVRAESDSPVAVNALKRYLTERPRPVAPHRPPPEGPRVAVVGAGPAGLACARELVRRGYAPTVLDGRARAGGMLEHALPDYRLPREVLRRDVDAVLAEGVRFVGGRKLGVQFQLETLREEGFAAVVLALGAAASIRPRLEGAGLSGVTDALTFLEEPPSCDGERVLVLGGGDVAVDAARMALRKGARAALLVFPESESQMAAGGDAVALARAEGAELRASHAVAALEGPKGRVARARLGRVSGFARDERGVRWERLDESSIVEVERVVFATGQSAALDGIELPAGVAGERGWLVADGEGRTRVPWLFAAGDIVTGPSTVTAAMAHGVRAAWAVDSYLANGGSVPAPSAPARRARRVSHRPLPVLEERGVLDASRAQDEARRCYLCGLCRNCNTCTELLGCPAIFRDRPDGRPRIDAALCISCDACVDACPNDAIRVAS